ncbi:YciI family protein [Mucilaginibacter sp.]|jgi:uncharacterized protein YciI|uniref:YciI family protein n=1 Tax=Mucilaginibacter sp. TaxID=1882438 RepID=UPI003566B720
MKKFIVLTLLVFGGIYASAQSAKPAYDAALAKSLGADEYGMKMYVLAILKSGTNKTDNKAVLDSLFRGHMANIGRLAANGKLVVAGPIEKNDKAYRGIFIFNVKTIAEANALLVTDPAINGKVLDAELYQWYGSAALPVYLDTHKKIEKTQH